jgi:hypothetical protein
MKYCETCKFHHDENYQHPSNGYEFRCQRCNHEWRSKVPGDIPIACAKCHASYWARQRLSGLGGDETINKGIKSPGKLRKRKVVKSKLKAKKIIEQANKLGFGMPPSMVKRIKG